MTFEHEIGSHDGLRMVKNYPSSNLTSFQIGGEIAYVLYPKTQSDLCEAVRLSIAYGLPYRIVGQGTNILAQDDPHNGVWIMTGDFCECAFSGHYVDVSAGITLSKLIEDASERGLSGIENLYGIPGSVGGAVCMNAGAFGTQFSDLLVSVTVYDTEDDIIRRLGYEDCEFQYRESVFQSGRYAILAATLRLGNSRTDLVRSRMERVMKKRVESQPLDLPSAGSVFKRPAGAYAGKLISECGLSGKEIGGAMVSLKHAGFIVNKGGATGADVRALIQLIMTTVYEKTGVLLTPELLIL